MLALLGLLVTGAADPSAKPQESSPLVVQDEGSLGCTSAADLRARVEQRLGHPLRPQGAGAISAEVRRWRAGKSWRAAIELKTTRTGAALGERTLEAQGKTCGELDASLVLVLALMLDAPHSEENAGEGRTAPPKAVDAKSPTTAPLGPRASAYAEDAGSLTLSGHAAFSLGTLPGLGIGAGFGGMWVKGGFGTGADIAIWPYAEKANDDRGTRFFHAGARPFACLGSASSSQAVFGCGSFRVGWLSAEGFGYETNRAEDRLTLAPGLSLRAQTTLSGALGASVEVGAEVGLLRHRFVAKTPDGGEREVFRMWRALPFLTVGLDFRIW